MSVSEGSGCGLFFHRIYEEYIYIYIYIYVYIYVCVCV